MASDIGAVFRVFERIAKIPRGSGNTAGIRKCCLGMAAELNLEAKSDDAGNVIIRKPGTRGLENAPRVLLQGHLDMVCAKTPGCTKDMAREGVELEWGKDYLRAKDTTLGADDGIAIAYAFGVLASREVPHPPLTVILTADEETGMSGAAGLSPDDLDGTYLLNLDSEEEHILTVGCAGGARVLLQIPVAVSAGRGDLLSLSLSGLRGGHSGTEIHRPLLNANVAMARLLRGVSVPFRLCDWRGGQRDNAIPTECDVKLLCAPGAADALSREILAAWEEMKAAYSGETEAKLEAKISQNSDISSFSEESTARALKFLNTLPNGVQKAHPTLSMPLTSLNIGVIFFDGERLLTDALVRSGADSETRALADKLCGLARAAGGEGKISDVYPAWEYKAGTALEQIALDTHKALFGEPARVQIIHAGLECGILAAKNERLSCVSFGPDILDIHTPRERLSLASAERTWAFLLALLQRLGQEG